MRKIIIAISIIILAGLGFAYYKIRKTETLVAPQDLQENTQTESAETNLKSYLFNELGISLQVPNELHVVKTANYNPDTGNLDSYTLYIQNYGNEGGPSTGDFQIYGLYQFDLPETTEEEFQKIKEDPTYSSTNEFKAGDLTGIEAQQGGERSNYVYFFLYKNRILRFSVSQPTLENKAKAEDVLKTLKVIDGAVDANADPQTYFGQKDKYTFTSPDGWKINPEVTDVTVESPDYKISEGYPVMEAGAELSVRIKKAYYPTINQELSANPLIATFPNKTETQVAGQTALRYEYSYEGVEAVMTEFLYNGNKYSLRFRFPDSAGKNTYMGVYEEMLSSFKFAE